MEAELYDIYSMFHVPFWQKEWFAGTVGFIGFLLCIGTIFLISRLLRPKKKPQSAWDVALANLNALKKGPHYSVHHSKEFYCALTDILKLYVQRRYDVKVLAATDEEFIAYLQQHQIIPAALLSTMDELVQGSVSIKFAHDTVVSSRLDDDFQRVVAIVRDTIPVQTQK
ncbi:MAG TPA: hypothetical protein VGT41_04980 [Candidatus Babeliales bacterium]|nr:hypothetical protein [Candidatus Babeliales bacterium]